MTHEIHSLPQEVQDENGDILAPVDWGESYLDEMHPSMRAEWDQKEAEAAKEIEQNHLEELMRQDQIDSAREDIHSQLEVIARKQYGNLSVDLVDARRKGDAYGALVIKQKIKKLLENHPELAE